MVSSQRSVPIILNSRAHVSLLKPNVGWAKFTVDRVVKMDRTVGCGGLLCDADIGWLLGFCNNMGTSNSLLVVLYDIFTTVQLILERNFPLVIIRSGYA